ncbi:hypothetical protein EJ06DRAFT_525816 [Trichodelitschia bisporula]|uniref:Glycosyl transferase family 25 domain-containing protein n=1 Tax=Trichodelitschia bisporula TaxID=703511 RepID=A0A6G1IB70_9PEZI|nr:hypothetical protein EJ06DRAFT_525816 [Trichodelitschia bisporula]
MVTIKSLRARLPFDMDPASPLHLGHIFDTYGRTRVLLPLVCLTGVLFLILNAASLMPYQSYVAKHESSSARSAHASRQVRRVAAAAGNRTLGFQKVFYISLPFRTDRQDGMSLIASLSGIDATHVPGVKGEDIHIKAQPPGWGSGNGPLGCWRSHANVWRRMLDENIETALIMEDDADWDVDIKAQMVRASRAILANPSVVTNTTEVKEGEPYRRDWDVFFMGQCFSRARKPWTGPVVLYDDPSMPEFDTLSEQFQADLNAYGAAKGQRAIGRAADIICTTGYAVTNKGAQRLLFEIGYKNFPSPVDNMISFRIMDGLIRGMVMVSPAISMFRVGGIRDSDNMAVTGDVKDNSDGSSPDLRNSVREWMKGYMWPDTPIEQYWPPVEVASG